MKDAVPSASRASRSKVRTWWQTATPCVLWPWITMVKESGLKPMIKAADTLKDHMAGVLRWFKSGLANGLLEGINSLLQAAKSKARGYRTIRNLVTMAYLIAGKLKFDLEPAWQTSRL